LPQASPSLQDHCKKHCTLSRIRWHGSSGNSPCKHQRPQAAEAAGTFTATTVAAEDMGAGQVWFYYNHGCFVVMLCQYFLKIA